MHRMADVRRSNRIRGRKLAAPAHPLRMAAARAVAMSVNGRRGDHVTGATISIVAMLIVGFGAYAYQELPVVISLGSLQSIEAEGPDRPIQPGEIVKVSWSQDWRQFCRVKFTPVITGEDRYPKSGEQLFVGPPEKLGHRFAERAFKVPLLVDGVATYRAIIEPDCWFDRNILQRSYSTPEITFTVAKIVK